MRPLEFYKEADIIKTSFRALEDYDVTKIFVEEEALQARGLTVDDLVIPVEISIYKDRTFSFILKTPPAADLLKKAAGIEKGSGVPNKDKVGQVSRQKLKEIAEIKMADLNANDVEAAMKIIAGPARNMGITIG